jgi:hypothetical protein
VALLRELLNAKDEALRAKDEVVLKAEEVVRAKNEVVRAKDEALQAQLQAMRVDLRAAADEKARAVEGVKLRGMVEYLSKTHGKAGGAQQGLDALFRDDVQLTRRLVATFSAEFKLLEADLDRCAGCTTRCPRSCTVQRRAWRCAKHTGAAPRSARCCARCWSASP